MHPTKKNILAETHDSNGTSLLSYVETLVEKIDTFLPLASFTIIVANPSPDPNLGDIEIISNVEREALPDALRKLSKDMKQLERQSAQPAEVN